MKLEIDESICTGHGRCYVLGPDLFESDEEGYGVAKDVEVAPDEATAAMSRCPERAISTQPAPATTE